LILKIFMKQGEIWLINLDPTVGAEIKKTRPAIIVSDDALGKLPLKVIVPVTDWKERYEIAPWMIKIAPNIKNGLSKESSADCFQVRSVSEVRFVKRIGTLTGVMMEDVRIGLSKVLSIEL
jgi:mRNA interferase MazF